MHDIPYLAAINALPKKYYTVQEILTQVKAKAKALGLTCTDFVLDHKIYAKDLEVLQNPNNANLKDFINLRIRGFHACGIFLVVIAKRFRSGGLHDLIVKAPLSDQSQ